MNRSNCVCFFPKLAAGFGGTYGIAIGFSLTSAVEVVYWIFIKPFGLVKEEQCTKCTLHHYPTPISKRLTTGVQKSCIAAFLIFTGFRFYLVFDRLFFNPPIPEDNRDKIYK